MIGVFSKLPICSEVLEVASSRHLKIFGQTDRQTDRQWTNSITLPLAAHSRAG